MSEQSAPPQPPPQARLAQMATGFILSRLVYTAASLGIADHLASSPKSPGELATPTGCDADSLGRFMRTLTNFGILALGDDGRFSLTPLGEPLRSDAPGSVRSSILTMGGQWSWKTWEAFPATVKTGKPAFNMVFEMPVFDWLEWISSTQRRTLRPCPGHDGCTGAATGLGCREPCNDSGGQRVRGRAAMGGRLYPLARRVRCPLCHWHSVSRNKSCERFTPSDMSSDIAVAESVNGRKRKQGPAEIGRR